jgi:hypothetical protein
MVMKASFRRSLCLVVSLGCVGLAAGACGSDDGDLDDPVVAAGSGGQNAAGKGGSAGKGGTSGSSGQGGANPAGAAGAESAGQGGTNEAGAAGEGGDAGTTAAGNAGNAGESAAGTGGASGGSAGASGSSGTGAGEGGSGGADAGTGGGGNAGAAGTAGTAGSSAGTGGSSAGTGGSSAGTGGSSAGTGGTGGIPNGGKFRIMASNLTSGNKQTYEEPGRRILRAMKADVILIQEFSVLTGTIDALVDDICGTECEYQRGGDGAGYIPNGVISRFPILEKGEWEDGQVSNRAFEWARIDIPGDRDLLAVSVHLLTKDGPRVPETNQLVSYIQAALKPTDYLVLGGDFNTSSYDDPAFATLSVILSTAAPYPADQSGNTGTNTNRLMTGKGKPYDHVLSDSTLRAFEIPVVIGASSFPSGFVVDTRVYTPISDLAPALVDDSGALNMQHMGVVRDFAVPLN